MFEEDGVMEDWENRSLNILSDDKNIKSSSNITGDERKDMGLQLFFGQMLNDTNIILGVDNHLKLNKSVKGFFPKLMSAIFRGRVERETPPTTMERVMQ